MFSRSSLYWEKGSRQASSCPCFRNFGSRLFQTGAMVFYRRLRVSGGFHMNTSRVLARCPEDSRYPSGWAQCFSRKSEREDALWVRGLWRCPCHEMEAFRINPDTALARGRGARRANAVLLLGIPPLFDKCGADASEMLKMGVKDIAWSYALSGWNTAGQDEVAFFEILPFCNKGVG